MYLLGVEIPTLTVVLGTIITAVIAGFGMGMGSELGKYVVEKYVKPRFEKIHSDVNIVIKSDRRPFFKRLFKRRE